MSESLHFHYAKKRFVKRFWGLLDSCLAADEVTRLIKELAAAYKLARDIEGF
jgi:hypothetical protein